MTELDKLQELIKLLAVEAGEHLQQAKDETFRRGRFLDNVPKEIKSEADTVLEDLILERLRPLGMAILSEESGYLPGHHPDHLWFIVDPLDGTYNFVRDAAPSAVSIALWRSETPVFGAVYELGSGQLYWGGPACGAYCGEKPIRASTTKKVASGSIHTGFPARMNIDDPTVSTAFWNLVRPFGKVRMIGSAAMSLISVATGRSDAYAERSIMLWDVAAGLPIVAGAGGQISITPLGNDWSCIATASNGKIVMTAS